MPIGHVLYLVYQVFLNILRHSGVVIQVDLHRGPLNFVYRQESGKTTVDVLPERYSGLTRLNIDIDDLQVRQQVVRVKSLL